MLISGIPGQDLERIHCYGGRYGRNAAGYKHVPSGICVVHEIPEDVSSQKVYEKSLAELFVRLLAEGIIFINDNTSQDTAKS
jgi:hypothetical protein